MVIEKAGKAAGGAIQEAEIISVKDLIPVSSSPAVAAQPAEGIEKIEGWLKLADKGISLLDRGVTIFGKADGIVKNLSDVAHHKLATQQQQQPPQQEPVIIHQEPQIQRPEQAPPPPPRIPILIQGKEAMMTPVEISQLIEQLQRPPVTADQISGILDMLLSKEPEMSVSQLKLLLDRNPDTINRLIAFGAAGGLQLCAKTNE